MTNLPQSDQPNEPPYQGSPPYYSPEPEQRRGLPGWAWALIIGGGGVTLLACVLIPIVVIGGLTLLGQRVSSVFSEIETGLVELPEAMPANTADALPLGTDATLTNLRVTITDARPAAEISGLMAPLLGNEYWLVDVTFENISSDQELWIEPYDSWMQDAADVRYDYYWEAPKVDDVFTQYEPLQPGATMTGTLVYEVAQDQGELFWIYQDVAYNEQAVFQIE